MHPRLRHTIAAVATVAALTLTTTACGEGGTKSSGGNSAAACEKALGKLVDKAATDPEAVENAKKPAACEGFTKGELDEMKQKAIADSMDEAFDDAASEQPGTGQADSELKVGETYTYSDDVAVTVDSITTISQYGEYDDKPSDGETAFRVNITIDNQSKRPVDLDDFAVLAEGATNGGEIIDMYIKTGSKQMTGRVAAGVKTAKTAEYAIADKYGDKILVSLGRFNDAGEFDMDEPHWTGTIK